jgi:hypothetical protein
MGGGSKHARAASVGEIDDNVTGKKLAAHCRKTRSERLKRSERGERGGSFSNFLFSA